MAAVNTYFPTTIQGTVAALIFNSRNLNTWAIDSLMKTLAAQFAEKTQQVLPQDLIKPFCSLVHQRNEADTLHPVDIVTSALFKSMMIDEADPGLQDKMQMIAQRTMQAAQKNFQAVSLTTQDEEQILAWYAKFMERVLSLGQIAGYDEPRGKQAEALMEQRGAIGRDMFARAREGEFTPRDLEAMMAFVQGSMNAFKMATNDHPTTALEFAGRYLSLVSQVEDPTGLVTTIFTALEAHKGQMFAEAPVAAASAKQ